MKIVVTGGAGFIGSHTAVALSKAGHWPVIIDDFRNSKEFIVDRLKELTGNRMSFHRADCSVEEALLPIFQKENPDGIIHFAAYKAVGESVREPLKYYRNNIDSLLALLHIKKNMVIPNFVFSSSCTVYGVPDQLPVSEESPVKAAASPYGYTKQAGERIIHDAQAAGVPIKAAILRYFNPIGAHPSGKIGELPLGKPENLIPYVTQTAAGIREKLTIFGKDYETPDGTAIRDYIHVMDIAEAHVRALEWLEESKNENVVETFNLGTGKGNSVMEVIKTFEHISGQKLNYTFGPRRAGDVPAVYADVRKAREILGWKAKRTLEDSLRDAWRWQELLSKNPV